VAALNSDAQVFTTGADLAAYLEGYNPDFQFEDRHTLCHPDNVKHIFPWAQGDLEYVFEIVLRDPSIALWKVNHTWGDKDAPQFAYQIYWSYCDWRFYSQERLERAVEIGGVVEHFYEGMRSPEGNAAMFQDNSNLVDLSEVLSKLGH